MIDVLLAKFGGVIAAIGAVIAIVVSAFFKGRSDGKRDVKREYDTAVAKRQAEVADKVRAKIHRGKSEEFIWRGYVHPFD